MDLLSVIIPSYNHSRYIKEAVDSVLTQSYSNLELIVVDDGSTDRSLDYLRTIKDPRYKLIEQSNSGAHSAINNGLLVARGNFLAILNSDDIFDPNRLTICIRKLNEGLDLVATWINVINSNGRSLGVKKGWHNMLPWPIEHSHQSMFPRDPFVFNLLKSNFVATTSNIVFSRKLYEKIGGMKNLRFVHDWDFLLRSARDSKCAIIEQPLLRYRVHQNNTISSDRAWMLFEICWIFAVHLKYFTEEFLFSELPTVSFLEGTTFLSKSINLQGNDKVLWMMLLFLEQQKIMGQKDPEAILIYDEKVRSAFMRHIIS